MPFNLKANYILKSSEDKYGSLPIIILLSIITIFWLFIIYNYSAQPPIEHHPFRQSQTAITAYWISLNGFKFNYETPVLGYPWSIPFEFPIYQTLVAYLAKIFGVSFLVPIGRLLSFLFLMGCLLPVYKITSILKLPRNIFYFFTAIFLTQPIYMFWGRAFMIETAALFFSLLALWIFIDVLMLKLNPYKLFILFIVASLALLQKITTALPIFIVMFIAATTYVFYQLRVRNNFYLLKKLFILAIIFLLAFLLCFIWIKYTDQIKINRNMGEVLTSKSLALWNWGSFDQRFSYEFWFKVVVGRVFLRNFGLFLLPLLIVYLFFSNVSLKVWFISISLFVLGFLPLFLFTNLHIVHDYYQVANIIFLTYLASFILIMCILPNFGKNAAFIFLLAFIFTNLVSSLKDIDRIKLQFDTNNRDIAIGSLLKRELSFDQQFVAFGNDWSSTFSFLSERKSLTAPRWLPYFDHVVTNPEIYVEPGKLGAIISCDYDNPSIDQVFKWRLHGNSKISESNGCYIITNERIINPIKIEDNLGCKGQIDPSIVQVRNGKKVIVIHGWSKTSNGFDEPDLFIRLTRGSGSPLYFEAMRVPNSNFHKISSEKNGVYYGYSRILNADTLSHGKYSIALIEKSGEVYHRCGQVNNVIFNVN